MVASNQFLDGHYLNLPVMNEAGEIVGMVDVLKLTYATLEQVGSLVMIYVPAVPPLIMETCRSTRCRPRTMRALHGTSSGCRWTMSPIRWFRVATGPIPHTGQS